MNFAILHWAHTQEVYHQQQQLTTILQSDIS